MINLFEGGIGHGTATSKKNITRQIEAMNLLDANVMIADAGNNICYLNDSLIGFLKDAENEIKKDLPSFTTEGLIGQNIDAFHKNPSHQQNLVANLQSGFKTSIQLGDRVFSLLASPLHDKKGQRIGTVVEWLSAESLDHAAQIDAINKSQAVIHFKPDGTILEANDNFCNAMGYSLSDIQARHHSMFVEEEYKNSDEYRSFWRKLASGEFISGEFKRIGSNGEEVWIQASYNPIFDLKGKTFKVVKFASDITAQKLAAVDAAGQIEAIGKSQAVISFNLDGTIIDANENFCNAMGYDLKQIQGKHHSMFAEPAFANSAEYKQFWEKLGRGEFFSGEFQRVGNGGKEVWIQASYNPIFDINGKPFKVVKYASDITQQKLSAADAAGQIAAIGKAQAVISFNLDGTIIDANENFCGAVGYDLKDIQGKHHSLFVEGHYANSREYKQFWEQLGKGEFASGEFKRIDRNGREVWIQASYNPIMDMSGKPFKVVKFATDITEQKLASADAAGQIEAIGKAQAVISFNLDGTIIDANENFCGAMGYDLEEIQGKHHSMFVEPSYGASSEYKSFWEKLRRGEFVADEFKRFGKGGKEIWIQASYNPILDMNGKPFKVVKFATDITGRKTAINEITSILRVMAEGDLTRRIEQELSGDFEAVRQDINKMLNSFGQAISESLKVSEEVSTAASNISNGTSDLSERTEQQAAALEETAASMEEMSSTVRNNADNAQQANGLSVKARDSASQGGKVISEAVKAMGQIDESSNKISDIIGVIDEIAFQTNLLALNAAVEAARAGDAGRGFAVVAAEVRKLAQRASVAAKDIKTLIMDSTDQVKSGVTLVNRTGESLSEILESVKSVTDIISEIASASAEQSTGIEQINDTVNNMENVTVQNSALVGENADAAKTLSDQAVVLRDQLSFFKILGDSRQSGQPAPIHLVGSKQAAG